MSYLIIPSILVTNWFFEKNGLALGIVLSGSGIGGMFYSAFAQHLIREFGYKTAYVFTAVIILVVLLPLILKFIYLSPKNLGLKSYGSTAKKENIATGLTRNEWIKTTSFYFTVISIITGGIIINGTIVNISPYLNLIGYHTGTAEMTMIISMGIGMMAVGKIVIGKIYDLFSIQFSIFCIGAFMLIFIICLLNANNIFIAFLYCLFLGISSGNANVTPPIFTKKISGVVDFEKNSAL